MQVINYVGQLIINRSRQDICVMSCFFYEKLKSGDDDTFDYSNVSRWYKGTYRPLGPETKLIMIPVNINQAHWIVVVVDSINKCVV